MDIKKGKILPFLFYLSYFLMMMGYTFTQVEIINNYLKYIEYLSVVILFIVFLMQSKNYTYKQLIVILCILVLSIVNFVVSSEKNLLKLVLLVLTFKDLKFDDFIKKDYYLKITLVLSIVFLYFMGFTEANQYYRDGVLRGTFGFKHPNILGLYLMMICLDYYYINRNKSFARPLIVSVIIAIIIFKYIDSRTTSILLICTSITIIINKLFNNHVVKNWITKFIVKNLYLILIILSVILTELYSSNTDFAKNINILLSGRLYFNDLFLSEYNINLFGNNIYADDTLILDSSYINILLRYGIIGVALFYVLLRKMINKAYNDKNYTMVIILTILILYGFTESFLYKVASNAFLIYMAELFKKKEILEKNNQKLRINKGKENFNEKNINIWNI